jgi:hypothetical protein
MLENKAGDLNHVTVVATSRGETIELKNDRDRSSRSPDPAHWTVAAPSRRRIGTDRRGPLPGDRRGDFWRSAARSGTCRVRLDGPLPLVRLRGESCVDGWP